jgi:hypothetical protein
LPSASATACTASGTRSTTSPPKSDLLWTLNRLCNVDKHQSLHLAGVSKTGVEIDPGGGGVTNVLYEDGPLHNGAELVRFLATPNPATGEMEVEVKITAFVSFSEDSAAAAGEPVSKTLFRIKNYIANDVFGPLAAFLR